MAKHKQPATTRTADDGSGAAEDTRPTSPVTAPTGCAEEAMALLQYACERMALPVLLRCDPWLARVREHPSFAGLVENADRMHRAAQTQFRAAGGEELIATPPGGKGEAQGAAGW
jgi:hypothetical protein